MLVGRGRFSLAFAMSVNSCDTDFEHVNAIIACYWGRTVPYYTLLYYIVAQVFTLITNRGYYGMAQKSAKVLSFFRLFNLI